MVDLALLQSVSYIAGALGVCVAAIYYIVTLRNNNKTRQAQLYMQIYSGFSSKTMSEADFDLMHLQINNLEDYKHVLENKELYTSFNQWMSYYEGVGVLVRENLIDIRLVAELFSGPLIWFWERYRPVIMEVRREWNFTRASIEVEYLYNRVKEYAKEHPELEVTSPVMGVESKR